MGIVRNKLFENPDRIATPEGNYSFRRHDAIPFGYWKGQLFVGEPGNMHDDMPGWKEIEKKLPSPPRYVYGKPRYYLENQGRLWKELKLISFWKYPKKEEFKKIIDELGEKIGQPDMFNDPEWRVEIVKGPKKDPFGDGEENNRNIKKDWDWNDYFYDLDLIPLKDYVGSNQRSQQELAQQHVASPMDRSKMQRPDRSQFFKVRDRKEKPLAWKQAMYAESYTVKPTLNESPDIVQADNLKYITGLSNLGYKSGQDVPFGYYNGKMFVGNIGEAHFNLGDKIKKLYDLGYRLEREDFDYAGRFWYDANVISFWKYPKTKKELDKVLKDIIEAAKGPNGMGRYPAFFDEPWYIEVIEKRLPTKKSSPEDDWDDALDAKLIPIQNYKGSEDQSAEEMGKEHVKSPMFKKRKPKDSGFFNVRDTKEKPLAWKQALMKSESMIVRSRINESPDEIIFKGSYFGVHSEGALAFEVDLDENKENIKDIRINSREGYHGDHEETYHTGVYPGRIYTIQKVITFWTYPNQKEFIEIVNLMEKKLGEKMWNNGWTVEVYKGNNNDPIKPGTKSYGNNYDRNSPNKEFVPVEKYMGSIEPPEKEKAFHLMNYKEKEALKKKGWGKGSGSDKYGKKRPLKMRQMMYSESLDEQALNEKLLIGEPISVPELRDLLHNKVINFEFIKLDGEVRPAKGTTMMKYIPKDQQPTGDNPSSEKVAAFYDLTKGEWRSVSNRSDEIVLKRDPETGKPKVVITDKEPKEEPTKPQYPKEKDVEQRPIVPKAEPVVRPSIKPEVVPPIPKPEEIEEPEEKEPLDIDNPNIEADEVESEEIIAPQQETPEVEEPEEPSQEYEPEKDISTSSVKKEDITFPPPEEDITFPEEEEESEE